MRMKSALSILAPAALLLQVSTASAAVCGDAYYTPDIDWPSTPSLYYSVAGAPPNTCGDLYAARNGGAYVMGAGWICTDSNGNATKGPWSSNPIDETAYVYIDWGTCTSPVRQHIWDVTPAATTITPNVPADFSGTATDAAWGAGFNASWTQCTATYRDELSVRWWDPSTGTYSSSSPVTVPCTVSGMPSMSITWSTTSTQRPALSLHVRGTRYLWTLRLYDGGQWRSHSINFRY